MSDDTEGSGSKFILWATPRSPFARRVRLALSLRGVPHVVHMTNVMEPSAEFLAANPLGLVPVLFDPGISEWVPDSDTQLDLLDESPFLAESAVKPIWPLRSGDRARVRARSRWATGMMTAAVAHFLEKNRSREADPEILKEHRDAILGVLAHVAGDMERNPALWVGSDGPTQAGWDLGVALEYLELRMPDIDWQKLLPSLPPFLQQCRQNAFFAGTTPPPA